MGLHVTGQRAGHAQRTSTAQIAIRIELLAVRQATTNIMTTKPQVNTPLKVVQTSLSPQHRPIRSMKLSLLLLAVGGIETHASGAQPSSDC